MWVLGVYVYLAVFYLIKKIDVNSIYKVNRRIRLILTFKSSASKECWLWKTSQISINKERRELWEGKTIKIRVEKNEDDHDDNNDDDNGWSDPEAERALLVAKFGKVMLDPLLCKKIPMNFFFTRSYVAAYLCAKKKRSTFFIP